MKTHAYEARVSWSAHGGEGTKNYRSYSRDHVVDGDGKLPIACSSDPAFRGDAGRYNPEELLVASLASCHMLGYLHLCAVNGVTVVAYHDGASGTMEETDDGGGQFARVVLKPVVTIAPDCDREKALDLHDRAHHLCFIARSVNFAVEVEAQIRDSLGRSQ